MPATRHNTVIQISDEDRFIDFTISVDLDVNGCGDVEHPAVELIQQRTWFGKSCTTYKPCNDPDLSEAGLKEINQYIEAKYLEEILQAILDVRESQRFVPDEA